MEKGGVVAGLVAHREKSPCKVNNYLKQESPNRESWTTKKVSLIFKSVVFWAKSPWKLLSCQTFVITSLWIIKSLKISASKPSGQTPLSVQDHVMCLEASKRPHSSSLAVIEECYGLQDWNKRKLLFFHFFHFFLSSLAVKGNNSVSPCNLTHRQKKIRLGTECFFLLKMVVIQKKLCQATSQVKMFQVVPNLPAYSSFDCVKSAAYVFWPCGHTSLSVKTKPNPFSPCWLNWQQLKPKY